MTHIHFQRAQKICQSLLDEGLDPAEIATALTYAQALHFATLARSGQVTTSKEEWADECGKLAMLAFLDIKPNDQGTLQ